MPVSGLNKKFRFYGWLSCRKNARLTRILLIPLVFLTFSLTAFSQETTYNNYSGIWSDNASWTDGSNPGVTNLNVDVEIYGFIRRDGNLSFNNGDLFVYDTLVINGDLTLGSNSNLVIGPGAILIVNGDYSSGNNVDASTDGYFIVTGNFSMTGSNSHGSFDNSGTVIIFDPTPSIKTGSGYTDLQCPPPGDYPDNCGYGDEDYLITDPIYEFFQSGGYVITASGPTTFCAGGSVVLSTESGGTNYQWYLDGSPISGATTYSYTASLPGEYDVTFDIGGGSYDLTAVTVSLLEAGFGYGYSMQMTVSQASGSEDLYDFPVLIHISSSPEADNLRTVSNGGNVENSNGYDIIFLDESYSLLDHEIEFYDAATGEYVAWVRVPVLSASSTTNLKILYGNPTVSADPYFKCMDQQL